MTDAPRPTFTEWQLDNSLEFEDLVQHCATLKQDYLDDAAAWIDHRDDKRVDAKFAIYSKALDAVKRRPQIHGLNPHQIHDLIDYYRRR